MKTTRDMTGGGRWWTITDETGKINLYQGYGEFLDARLIAQEHSDRLGHATQVWGFGPGRRNPEVIEPECG